MKPFIYVLLLLSIASCTTDPAPETEMRIYQVIENGQGPLIPIALTDYNDGTGVLVGQVIFDNTTTNFDLLIDDVDGDRHTMFMTPFAGEALSLGGATHAGTFWNDSISFTIAYELGGIPIERVYTGTR